LKEKETSMTEQQNEELNEIFKNELPEVKIVIHRGSKEIGGTCIQLSTNNCSILLDVGHPLSPESKPIDISKIKTDAVLISHPHQDHYGLLDEIDKDTPVYIGELGKRLMDATKIFLRKPVYDNNFKYFKRKVTFEIGDFKITPYLMDHSAVDAFSFLIEIKDRRVFYSGDFRAHGRKSILFDKLVENPPQDIDLLFMEGTMIRRSNEEFPDEKSVEEKIFETIRDQRNITFFVSSSQNIDRIVSVYRACKKSGKMLVIDTYTAWVLEQIQMVSKATPNIERDEVGFFADHRQNEVLKQNNEYFGNFSRRLYKSRITKEELRDNPSKYVYFSKMSTAKWIKSFKGDHLVNVIYSQWLGYLNKTNDEYFGAEEMNHFKDDPEINFVYAHTSGHATVEDLQIFATAINAKKVVPIHTEYGKEYESNFDGVHILDDDYEFLLK
jgi:ribonuclease J